MKGLAVVGVSGAASDLLLESETCSIVSKIIFESSLGLTRSELHTTQK